MSRYILATLWLFCAGYKLFGGPECAMPNVACAYLERDKG